MVGFTIALRESQDFNLIKFCLDGFNYIIYLLGKYKLEVQRDAFMRALYSQTGLEQNVKLNNKNILCM